LTRVAAGSLSGTCATELVPELIDVLSFCLPT
jgi:hypothetical protein